MSELASIALACTVPDERAAVAGWLSESGYDPIPIPDFSRLDDNLRANAIEAVIADMALFPREDDVWGIVRRLGSNRPLVVLGDVGGLPSTMLGDLSVVPRPVTRDALLLSVGLALGEGRPARRYPRRFVEPIPASAQGMAVTVREASAGGVGIEIIGARSGVLPPYFSLRIPDYGVHVVVKRAWLAPAAHAVVRCGGTIEGDLPDATQTWSEFAREAPAPIASVSRRLVMQ